jgi:hypothetical protein
MAFINIQTCIQGEKSYKKSRGSLVDIMEWNKNRLFFPCLAIKMLLHYK